MLAYRRQDVFRTRNPLSRLLAASASLRPHSAIEAGARPLPPRRGALAVLLTGGLAGRSGSVGAQGQATVQPTARAEIPLPALGSVIALPELTLLDGSRLDASARAGKTVVLYWWASWCPFCAEQSPLMDKLWLSEREQGLLVLGLSIDRQPEPARAYLKRKGYRFPSAWLSPTLATQLPKPRGLPVTVVLSPQGKVLAAESGQMFEEDVAELARWAKPAR